MFSSISSYIWGQADDLTNSTAPHATEVEDWVVVGAASADTFNTRDDDRVEETVRGQRHHNQYKASHKQELQSMMFGQNMPQNGSAGMMSRSNMAMMGWAGKQQQTRQNFCIKMAGRNKNLKQC